MLVRQGFQYAARLKAKHEALVRRWVGCRRFVYNEALAFQRAEIDAGRTRPSYEALCARLPGLRRTHPWLGEPPAQALQQGLRDLCEAWRRKSVLKIGAPRFKRRGEGDSIRFPQGCAYFATAGVVRIPKLRDVRLRHSRPALGTLKNVTLRFERNRLLVSLQTEREVNVLPTTVTSEVGLDFGVKTSIMTSIGEAITLPARIGRYERRMRRLQQAASRKSKGSNNRRKTIARLVEFHRRIAAIRSDFLHKETTRLVRKNALIVIEDLRVRAMTASAAGTLDAPGTNVRQKASLNRSILRNGWGMARSMLEYKCAWSGTTLLTVPPAYSSQQCSRCGRVAVENRRSQARFACIECGHSDNADRNAAQTILLRGREILASGCPPSTAGYAGTHACEGGVRHRRRPRSAARGSAVGLPLAGTCLELSPSSNLHP